MERCSGITLDEYHRRHPKPSPPCLSPEQLIEPAISYMYGFLLADGHLRDGSGQKGSLCISIAARDRYILEQFQSLVPCYSSIREATRSTNFVVDYESVAWQVSNLGFRNLLKLWGMPSGRKKSIVQAPMMPFSTVDFYRGFIDGDGSVGFTGAGLPFVSLVIVSDALLDGYLAFLKNITGKERSVMRSKRDNVYNVMVMREDACLLVNALYYKGCLALPRKMDMADAIRKWCRPIDMKIKPKGRPWTDADNAYVLEHSLSESMIKLGRTFNAVNIRRHKLRRMMNDGGVV